MKSLRCWYICKVFCSRASTWRLILLLLLSAAFALPLWGAPITYIESLTASFGKLGPVPFSNAILILTFQGDTTNVVPYSVPGSHGFEILTGSASVQVKNSPSGPVIAQGTFLPAARIFISADCTNGGVGFGSFAVADQHLPNFPGLVAYPGALLGPDCYDLKSNFEIGSGPTNTNFAWVLVNPRFPFAGWNLCGAPPTALPTTSGDLFVNFQPCQPTTWKRGEFSGTLTAAPPLETHDRLRSTPATQSLDTGNHSHAALATLDSSIGPAGNVYFPGILKITGAQTFEVSGALAPGIVQEDLISKGLTVKFGKLSVVIPNDSIKRDANGFTFSGMPSGISVNLAIMKRADTLDFQMKGTRAELSGIADSSPVLVAIGNQ